MNVALTGAEYSTVVDSYQATFREKNPPLQKDYADAYTTDKTDIGRNKYNVLQLPNV